MTQSTSPLRRFSLTRPDGTLKSAEELQQDANDLVLDAQARGARLRTELAANVAEATSKNQAAAVSVTATGGLQSVRLNERIKSMSPGQVSASIMEAYQAAARQAVARTNEITASELGSDRAAALMREFVPDVDPTDERG